MRRFDEATRGGAGDETATNGVSREGDGVDGSLLNNSKFKTPVRKLYFSPYSKGQMKNF